MYLVKDYLIQELEKNLLLFNPTMMVVLFQDLMKQKLWELKWGNLILKQEILF